MSVLAARVSMRYLVAYDGQDLSVAALERAAEYATAMAAEIITVTVVPNDEAYARDRGWIPAGESFTFGSVTKQLRAEITDSAPAAEAKFVQASRNASPGLIASKIRGVAREVDPSVVFIGSDNAGGLVTPISSVGGTLSGMANYDVYLVRHTEDD